MSVGSRGPRSTLPMLALLAVAQVAGQANRDLERHVAGAVLTNVGHLRSCEWEDPSRTATRRRDRVACGSGDGIP